MKKTTNITIALFSFLLFSCTPKQHIQKITVETQQITTSGFSKTQRQELKKTIAQFKSLKPEQLKMDKTSYQRLSRFENLFGFAFNGSALSDWVLSRFEKISYGNSWTVALNQNRGTLIIGDLFFSTLSDLERLYLLVHEARHSDSHGFKHKKCPKDFPFISAGQPAQALQNILACDGESNGAYAYQAAFLFEIFAYGLFDQREAGLLYNSSISRIIQ